MFKLSKKESFAYGGCGQEIQQRKEILFYRNLPARRKIVCQIPTDGYLALGIFFFF